MRYRVVTSASAVAALEEQAMYLREQGAPEDRVAGWLRRMLDAVDALEKWLHRHGVAHDVSDAIGFVVRRLYVDDYGVLYRVDDAAGVVEILAVRHGRRRPWTGGTAASDEPKADEPPV